MGDIHDVTALELAAAIRHRELSPVEIVDHYLERIDRIGPSVGAFITVTGRAARERAKRAERAVLDGTPLPPLHGVPTAIKDLNHTAGVRTTHGSVLGLEDVPDFDDHVVELLAQAGTNSLGKTNVPEYGYPFYTENRIAPPARTPWDLSRSAGGSSGGAAAAVASGLLPFAQGSDGGGSLRLPCSVTGLYGIKPSRGRVSNGPASTDTTAFSCNGPISRSVADAAAMLDAMAVPIPTEAYQTPSLPPGDTFLGYARRGDVPRMRIGRYIEPCAPDITVDPDCVAAWEHASTLLAGLGHEVVDIDPPFTEEFWAVLQTLHRAGQTTRLVDLETREKITPLARWMQETGSEVPVAEFLAAMKGIRMWSRRVIRATAGCDALLTPTLAQPPRPIGWFTDGVAPEETLARMTRFSPFTGAYNATGQPCVSLPLWWNEGGLPIGVMLAGRPFDEATLISLSAQLEQAAPWRQRVPDMW
nr:amidase [Streptomyces albidoflavus]